MAPFGTELRQRVIDAYDADEGSIRELADRFVVNKDTICEWLRLRRETGGLEHRPMGGFRGCLLSDEENEKLRMLVAEKNDRSQQELANLMRGRHRISMHRATVGRYLVRMHFTRKKRPFEHARHSTAA